MKKRTQRLAVIRMSGQRVHLGGLIVNPDDAQITWATLRSRILAALEPHPEARQAIAEQIEATLGLKPETRIQP
jgi:hypothetical protein